MPNPSASTEVQASADDVWQVVRPFDGSHTWHPSLPEASIVDDLPADTIGCVRVFTVNGNEVRERLLELDDDARRCRYALEQGTMPVRNYVGTLHVEPIGDDRARVEWAAEFECDPELEAQLTGVFEQGVFGPGVEALRERFA
jgi:Polyketide cyclase / dehydrase and lipid transport